MRLFQKAIIISITIIFIVFILQYYLQMILNTNIRNIGLTLLLVVAFFVHLIFLYQIIFSPLIKLKKAILKDDEISNLTLLRERKDEIGEIAELFIKSKKINIELKEELEKRENIEMEMIEEQLKYKQMFDNNDAIKIVFNYGNGEIVEVNNAACKYYGYTNAEFIKKSIYEIVDEKSEILKREFQSILKREKSKLIKKARLKEGLHRDIEIVAGPVLFRENMCIFAIIDDITELIKLENLRKEYENEILTYSKELEKLNKTKDTFFSIIAHDLKGPIGNLALMFDRVSNNKTKLNPESAKEFIEIVKESLDSSYSLLLNLLEWARMQKGDIPYNPKMVNLSQIIEKCFGLLKHIADNKEINLEYVKKYDETIFVDEQMIFTVVRNIVSNAIKFTPRKGIIRIDIFEQEERIELVVEDNGVGMTPKTLEKLFKIGEKVYNEGTDGEKGTGLGLIMCRDFVLKMGGEIRAESEVDKGSRFIITLLKK